MHGFINSPALATFVARQTVEEQVRDGGRARRSPSVRPLLRTPRWLRRRASPSPKRADVAVSA
jgi:hypothetical protein